MTPPETAPSDARRAARRVLAIVLVLNLAVAAAKLLVGWLIDSISMVADGFHSLTDSASNVIGLAGLTLASRPPDEDHPYGHHKIETLAALSIGGLLALTAWEIFQSCIERLHAGGAPDVTAASLAVMGVTIAVNLGVSSYERRRGEALGSEVLRADAAHTRSDVYVSLGVIGSLLAVRWGYPQVDLVAALVITAIIARAAFQILRQSAEHLVDPAVLPVERVHEVALAVPGVEGVHKVRTRGRPGAGYADLHVQLRPDLRLDQAHVIGHLVDERLRRELGLADVVVHVEPPLGHRIDWRPEDGSAGSVE